VRALVREAHDFIFDRRTITRPDTFDGARVHRRLGQGTTNDIVRLLRGVRDVATHLLGMVASLAEERKHRDRHIARLLAHQIVIQRVAVETRRRAGFQARDTKRHFTQAICQFDRGRISRSTAGLFCIANKNSAAKERAHRQHYRCGKKLQTQPGNDAGDATIFDDEIFDRLLKNGQSRLVLEHVANRLAVKLAVRLRTRCADSRPLACIQSTKLDSSLIDRLRHRASQCIDLFRKMTLANAADGRVTAHLPKRCNVLRY